MTLIAPVRSDPVENFPIQNDNNLNIIDASVGPLTVQSYIPVLTAAGTNPNLGSTGTITGRFFVVFDIVYTWGQFRFNGTGIDSGDSTYQVTLPFSADSQLRRGTSSGDGIILGSGGIYDSSDLTKRQSCTVQLRDQNNIMFNLEAETNSVTRAVSGSSNGIPLHWAAGEGVEWAARYKRITQ